jgi:hypothetical protein
MIPLLSIIHDLEESCKEYTRKKGLTNPDLLIWTSSKSEAVPEEENSSPTSFAVLKLRSSGKS